MRWLDRLRGQSNSTKAPNSTESLDAATLRQLAVAGADLAKPTEVVSYLYLPDDVRANDAATELRAAGYEVTVRQAATGSTWLALAKIDIVPSAENIELLRQRFEALAGRLQGDFDGWEAAVTT